MSSLMQILGNALDGQAVERIAGELGVDSQSASTAINMALPILIGGLSRNAATPEGAGALDGALARDHDGSILDDLGSLVMGSQGGVGQAILGHILGVRQEPAQDGISRATGLDGATVSRLLALLAPIVMGALGRARGAQGPEAGLGGLLGGAQEHYQQQASPGMDLLGLIFDREHDGSISDDVARLGAGLLGGLLGGPKP